MSTYCIGDLHGRYDLFRMLLEKIQFTPECDHVYVLGDVIDGDGKEGIKIIEYMMNHCDSMTLLRGNHEMHFLDVQYRYDKMMEDVEIGLPQESIVLRNKDLFSKNFFRTKNFALELLGIGREQYINIIEFLSCAPKEILLNISNKKFKLLHYLSSDDTVFYSKCVKLRHVKTENIYYVFGHEPIPKIHRYIWEKERNAFDFNFRKIFSYIDIRNNHYYNLDTGSNPIVALRLEDMNEYYVGIPPIRNESCSWMVPVDVTMMEEHSYKKVDEAMFYISSRSKISFSTNSHNGYAFVSIRDNCYEYLIGIQKRKKRIVYTRVDWLDYNFAFEILDWYDNQTDEDIIEKVHEDFLSRYKNNDLQIIDRMMCGYIHST